MQKHPAGLLSSRVLLRCAVWQEISLIIFAHSIALKYIQLTKFIIRGPKKVLHFILTVKIESVMIRDIENSLKYFRRQRIKSEIKFSK